jgi:hypothetical protein
MTESQDGPGLVPEGDGTLADSPGWGRLLDAAGVAAGLLLLVIVADVLSDGRLISRRLYRRGEEPGDPAE